MADPVPREALDSSTAPLTQPESPRNARSYLPTSTRPLITRIDSSERRRRLTSPEHGRVYPYRMSPGGTRQSPSSRSQQSYHHRTTSEYLPRPPPYSAGPLMSDLVPSLPEWQSDDDVQSCPICKQDFTIFFRKHHCRKCGRVVCGDCSRHRISIPSRYIVQAPWSADNTQDDPTSSESVRVCNPCVPDPWTPPGTAAGNNSFDSQRSPLPLTRYNLPANSPPPPPGLGHMHRHSADITRLSYILREPQHHGSIAQQEIPNLFRPDSQPPVPPRYSSHPRDRRSFPLPPRPDSATRPLPVFKPTPPRRIVKEEDECPVCGIELAPGQELREQHIQECVSTRFGGPSSTPKSASAISEEHPEEASSSSPSVANRIRAQSYRSRGLYQYKATEKDCVDGEGSEQECPICMEEFQPGDTLGRLECLCRFHHKCIRDWWARRGPGMCPVHASHE